MCDEDAKVIKKITIKNLQTNVTFQKKKKKEEEINIELLIVIGHINL